MRYRDIFVTGVLAAALLAVCISFCLGYWHVLARIKKDRATASVNLDARIGQLETGHKKLALSYKKLDADDRLRTLKLRIGAAEVYIKRLEGLTARLQNKKPPTKCVQHLDILKLRICVINFESRIRLLEARK